jgi:3-hydroxyacyl-CoA dehydrogenase/enoyl-CoA hydratase/3-hydroxybutyryl-CoA epimerase
MLNSESEERMNSFHYDIRDNGIAVLAFDLPGEKVNKLTTPVMDELDSLLDDLSARRDIKALVVTSGKPDTFIAGADIAEIRDITDAGRGSELSRRGQAVMSKVEALPFPTVAAIHGACLGGGLELALACSYRVISSDPRTVLGLPEIRIGIIPGFGGTQRLPRLVGLANGLEMILTGKSVHPKKAKKIGLADEVTHKENLIEVAAGMARTAMGRQRPAGLRARLPFTLLVLESNPLGRAFIYAQARKKALAETRGNYPAPLAALDAVRTGLARGTAAGYDREAGLIGQLITSDVSKNLIHVFYLNEALKRVVQRPSSFAVERAGVIGAGIMGGGIAQLFAEKGVAVRMKDITPAAVSAGLRAAADLFRKRTTKGILGPLQARDGMDRISVATDMTGFGGVDIAVEAVVENLEVKKQVLREFEAAAKDSAIFASNTSSLSIDAMASDSKRPDRVAGMHFFNPVEKMPLVEVVRGRQTSDATVAAVATLARRLGKLPVVVNDGPGFLVNRILMPYLGESLRMLEEGGAIDGIDDALMHFGMPMGAFVLLDEIGIDVAWKVGEVLRQGLGERAALSPLLATLHKKGFHGRKNGRGFYLYMHGRRGGPSPLIYQMITKQGREGKLTPEEIVERPVMLMIKEAALCMEDRIIDRADLLDAALVFGIGFPPFRGGLLRYADALGAKKVVERLEALAEKFGDRFAPPASLREMSRDDFIGQVVR